MGMGWGRELTGDAAGLTALAVGVSVCAAVALFSMVLRGRSVEVIYTRWLFHNVPLALLLVWFGRAIALQRPGHGLGRLFLVIGPLMAAHVAMISLADARMVAAGVGESAQLQFVPSQLPLDASVSVWMSSWLWLPAPIVAGTLLLLLFGCRPPAGGGSRPSRSPGSCR